MTRDHNNHRELLGEMRVSYKSVGSVYCPALKENVYFNSKGFRHLQFKNSGVERETKEQIYKLSLLPLVIPVIKLATHVENKRVEFSKKSGKVIEYLALGAEVGKHRILVRVILKRQGKGQINFHSIMKPKKKKQPS